MATSPSAEAAAVAVKPVGSPGSSQIIRTSGGARFVIYTILVIFCLYYLLPLYVMVVNSLKPLAEIQAGGMMSLPREWTLAPWGSAWSTAQIGVEATGLRPFFLNSILMVVPAVAISTVLGALNGYVLTKWRFRGDVWVFGLLLFGCFIPFQMVLIPMARLLGPDGDRRHRAGADLRAPRLRHRLLDALLQELLPAVPDRAGARGDDRRRRVLHHLPADHAALVGADRGGLHHLAVHQHLERLPVRRLVLRLRQPADDGGAQQPRPVLDRA